MQRIITIIVLFLTVLLAVLLILSLFAHAAELTVAGGPGMRTQHYGNAHEVKDWQAGPVLYAAVQPGKSRWSLVFTALDFEADSIGEPCRYAGAGLAYDVIQWERLRLSLGATAGTLYKPASGFNGNLAGFPFLIGTVDVWRGFFVGGLATAFPDGGKGWVAGVVPMVGWRWKF